jgi:hypothetical protein
MSTSQPPYERLSRPRNGLNGLGSVWLGKDHLLLVSTALAVERYRRWYFRDIQALVIRRTSARMIWNLILAVPTFLLLAGAVGAAIAGAGETVPDQKVVAFVLSGFCGVFGLGFLIVTIINSAMGPACALYIQTPYGLDRLPTPNRVPAVEKLTARLQPMLLAAQTAPGDQAGLLREVAAALDQPTS